MVKYSAAVVSTMVACELQRETAPAGKAAELERKRLGDLARHRALSSTPSEHPSALQGIKSTIAAGVQGFTATRPAAHFFGILRCVHLPAEMPAYSFKPFTIALEATFPYWKTRTLRLPGLQGAQYLIISS